MRGSTLVYLGATTVFLSYPIKAWKSKFAMFYTLKFAACNKKSF